MKKLISCGIQNITPWVLLWAPSWPVAAFLTGIPAGSGITTAPPRRLSGNTNRKRAKSVRFTVFWSQVCGEKENGWWIIETVFLKNSNLLPYFVSCLEAESSYHSPTPYIAPPQVVRNPWGALYGGDMLCRKRYMGGSYKGGSGTPLALFPPSYFTLFDSVKSSAWEDNRPQNMVVINFPVICSIGVSPSPNNRCVLQKNLKHLNTLIRIAKKNLRTKDASQRFPKFWLEIWV